MLSDLLRYMLHGSKNFEKIVRPVQNVDFGFRSNILEAFKHVGFKNDQCNFLYHALLGNPVFRIAGLTGFADLMQRSYENSKGSDQPEGPARIQRWRRVLRTIE